MVRRTLLLSLGGGLAASRAVSLGLPAYPQRNAQRSPRKRRRRGGERVKAPSRSDAFGDTFTAADIFMYNGEFLIKVGREKLFQGLKP